MDPSPTGAPTPPLPPPPPAGATRPSDLLPALGAPPPKQISMLHVLRLFFVIGAGIVGWQICVLLRFSPERKMLGIVFGMLVAFAFSDPIEAARRARVLASAANGALSRLLQR